MSISNETATGARYYDSAPAGLSFSERIRLALRRAAVRRQIVGELEPLRDRELADLGISRADIHTIARQHAEMTVTAKTIRQVKLHRAPSTGR